MNNCTGKLVLVSFNSYVFFKKHPCVHLQNFLIQKRHKTKATKRFIRKRCHPERIAARDDCAEKLILMVGNREVGLIAYDHRQNKGRTSELRIYTNRQLITRLAKWLLAEKGRKRGNSRIMTMPTNNSTRPASTSGNLDFSGRRRFSCAVARRRRPLSRPLALNSFI